MEWYEWLLLALVGIVVYSMFKGSAVPETLEEEYEISYRRR